MDNNTSISEDQIAYLNANLDLASEYMSTQLLSKYGQINCIVAAQRHSYGRINIPGIGYVCVEYVYGTIVSCKWRNLLQYVEYANNAPPIFK